MELTIADDKNGEAANMAYGV